VNASSSNAFAAAVQWLTGTLLGSLATALAVIAVASFGFLLLVGRIDVRRAMQVIFGCFILFGASAIASGMMSAVRRTAGISEEVAAPLPLPTYQSAPLQPANANTPYDPYAGAALPARR
jgi:type IV secretion system protein VirB2